MRFLIVEDDHRLLASLKQILEREGYSVDVANNYTQADDKVFVEDYDLVILDWMLPDGNGIDLCKSIRAESITIPILILTAKGMAEDLEEGLDAGADDYLVKPFESVELLARIRALLRRKESFIKDDFMLDTLNVNFLHKTVTRSKKTINLTPKEFLILEYLARNNEKAIGRSELLSHIWDENYEIESNIVDVYINFLRKKIDLANELPLIKTVKGVGYRLCKN